MCGATYRNLIKICSHKTQRTEISKGAESQTFKVIHLEATEHDHCEYQLGMKE